MKSYQKLRKVTIIIVNRIYIFLSLLHLKISTIGITYSQNILRMKNNVCVENFFTGALLILLQSNRVLALVASSVFGAKNDFFLSLNLSIRELFTFIELLMQRLNIS